MKALKALIRHKVLRGNASDLKELFLTTDSLDILSRIGSKDITSRWLSDELDISMQLAYKKLEILRVGGYLTRENIGRPRGGNTYQYGVTRVVSILNS